MKSPKNLYIFSLIIFFTDIFSSDKNYFELENEHIRPEEEFIFDEIEQFYPNKKNLYKDLNPYSLSIKSPSSTPAMGTTKNNFLRLEQPSLESSRESNKKIILKDNPNIRKILKFFGLSYSSDLTWDIIEEAYRKKIEKIEKDLEKSHKLKSFLENIKNKGNLFSEANNVNMAPDISFGDSFMAEDGMESREFTVEG